MICTCWFGDCNIHPRAPVLDPKATKRRREIGMALVEANTDPDWQSEAYAVILDVAKSLRDFTCDQVWERRPDLLGRVHNRSALGPVMTHAAKNKLIARAWDEPDRSSKRKETHGRPQRVWKSLVYGGLK